MSLAIESAPSITHDPSTLETGRGRVFLIDRDEEFRAIMRDAFDRHGLVAAEGALVDSVCLDEVAQSDVVVREVAGEVRRGLQALERVRQHAGGSDVRILCVSHHEQSMLRVLALDGGADDFVVKPIASDELVARVRAQLRRARQLALLVAQSRVAALTGVRNRRGVVEELERALAWSRRSGEPCSLVALDVDELKPVNDRLGHAAGDALLCAVAAALGHGARREDVVGRLGGDEFVVVLPRADAAGAARVMQRIERRLAELVIPSVTSTVRASLGAVTSRGGEFDAATMLARADAAMYAAKRRRRAAPPLRLVGDDDAG